MPPDAKRRLCAVIPTLNQQHRLPAALEAMGRGSRVPDRVFIIDNGGPESRIPGLPRIKTEGTIIRPERNLGVAASWNLGATLAGDADLLVLNDDVVLGPSTIERLTRSPSLLVTVNESWSCFLWTREARDRVGTFDEGFFPAYFEDCDYSYRLRLAGTPHANVTDPDVHHAGSATLHAKSDAEKAAHHHTFEANAGRYVAKWGGMPRAERYTMPFGESGAGGAFEVVEVCGAFGEAGVGDEASPMFRKPRLIVWPWEDER